MPVIVTTAVPAAAVALAVKVRVLVAVVGLGLKEAVTPFGKPVAERVTLPVKPLNDVTVIVLVPGLTGVMVRLVVSALTVKSNGQLFTRL